MKHGLGMKESDDQGREVSEGRCAIEFSSLIHSRFLFPPLPLRYVNHNVFVE